MEPFDRATILAKYEVDFYRCPGCGLIALPDPWWLDEAYESAIYAGDMGLLRRSRLLSRVTAAVIRAEGLSDGRFLDWGGGFGTLTRMMRDKGLEFYTADAYATNILAPGFDGDETQSYDLVTTFEVMEHLQDPVSQLEVVSRSNDLVFFTTVLQPAEPPRPDEWWYYALESGQHIAMHTEESLRIVADRLGYQLTSDGDNYHLFHRRPLKPATRVLLSKALARSKRGVVQGVRRAAGARR